MEDGGRRNEVGGLSEGFIGITLHYGVWCDVVISNGR